MADLIAAEEFRAYLVALGIGHAWSEAPSALLPGIAINPRDGEPEPRPGENITITIMDHPELPGPWFEGFLQHKRFEFIVRSRTRPPGELVQRQIRAAFEEKKGINMGRLRIEWSKLIAGESPVASDETSYTSVQAFGIAYRIVSLTV